MDLFGNRRACIWGGAMLRKDKGFSIPEIEPDRQLELFSGAEIPRVPVRAGSLAGCGMMLKHPLHNTWKNAIFACERPDHAQYSAYGGRGVRVCHRWRVSFRAFCSDLVPLLPAPAASCWLERLDKCGDYEPLNVRWRLLDDCQPAAVARAPMRAPLARRSQGASSKEGALRRAGGF